MNNKPTVADTDAKALAERLDYARRVLAGSAWGSVINALSTLSQVADALRSMPVAASPAPQGERENGGTWQVACADPSTWHEHRTAYGNLIECGRCGYTQPVEGSELARDAGSPSDEALAKIRAMALGAKRDPHSTGAVWADAILEVTGGEYA